MANEKLTVKTYLGDGAYVEHGCFRGEVILTTDNGIIETNRVVLDPSGVAVLLRWLKAEGLLNG